MMSRCAVSIVSLLLTACIETYPPTRPYDLLIAGGTVVDGSGAPRYRADVAIRGDRIAGIARDGVPRDSAADVIDATGLVVSPGFIDNHAHIATNIHEYPLAENFIHRVGRTGRAGESGVASTFFTREQRSELQQLERTLGIRMERMRETL